MVAVQPAVRSPFKGIKRFMRILVAKTIQQDLRLSGRLVATFVNRNEHKIGRGPNPYPTKAHFNADHQVPSVNNALSTTPAPTAAGHPQHQHPLLPLPPPPPPTTT